MLVDQTDIRHLETFSHLLREDFEENDLRNDNKEVVDLEDKIRILYVNPQFNTMKPFNIESSKTLVSELT